MSETRRLKNVVVFIQTVLSFVLSRKIRNIYNNIVRKYGNATVKDIQKHEKLEYQKNELNLDIKVLNFQLSFLANDLSNYIFSKNKQHLPLVHLYSQYTLNSTSRK